ncbi:hypothetical protein [Ornithinimicrobium kibberense]|uniref:hypothetical protein n=1 Tax=Ornithinimicrobium kibberense TaxID=282060 RepID=UPI00360BE76E
MRRPGVRIPSAPPDRVRSLRPRGRALRRAGADPAPAARGRLGSPADPARRPPHPARARRCTWRSTCGDAASCRWWRRARPRSSTSSTWRTTSSGPRPRARSVRCSGDARWP